jgi:hypothetical protein
MGKPAITGWEPAQYIDISPEYLRTNISWDTLSGLDDHGQFGPEPGAGDIYANGGTSTMLNIGQQTWGVWNLVTGGQYIKPTSYTGDAWDVYDLTGMTTTVDSNYVGGSWLGGIGSLTPAGGKWSDGKIEGTLDAIWIGLRKDGTLSGRRVNGEVVGNYKVDYIEVDKELEHGTWQAASAGEWMQVNDNLLSSPGLDQNILALGQAADVPITVVYSSVMEMPGASGGITSMSMDTHLYNMGPGGDGIWAAIINGYYTTAPTTNWSITVQNGADNATLSGPAWSAAAGQWTATSVSGTVGGNAITGQAAGTYGSKEFHGAGTGTYE